MEGCVILHIPNSRLHDNLFRKPGGQSSPLINACTPNLIEESPRLLGIGVSESSSWLHPWPFFIWGHGGLFFPGWLCLSTWPHKDRQRWLSYVNTCWGIAPLTLHEICPNKPNVSTGIAVCPVPFDIKRPPIKPMLSTPSSLRLLRASNSSDRHTRCLLQGVFKALYAWQDSNSSNLQVKFMRLHQIWQRHHGLVWPHMTASSLSLSSSLWLIVNTCRYHPLVCHVYQLMAVSYVFVQFYSYAE